MNLHQSNLAADDQRHCNNGVEVTAITQAFTRYVMENGSWDNVGLHYFLLFLSDPPEGFQGAVKDPADFFKRFLQ